jgi:transcriptional regulator with XRE-family HTH domain
MQAQIELADLFMMIDQKTFFCNLGKRLADIRKSQGLTQCRLAELANCSQQLIAGYEAGLMNVWRLVNIANVLGVDLNDLVKDSDSAPRKRGPLSRAHQLAEQVDQLPRSQQRFVIQMLENALQSPR